MKFFTLHFYFYLFFSFTGLQQINAKVSKVQLIEYISKSSYSNYKELDREGKEKAFKSIEQSFNTGTLSTQQRLDVYSILLVDIGLDKPESAKFKAIMLYQMEKYDLQHTTMPLYNQPNQVFIDFVNTIGENLIYEKAGVERTTDDIKLAKAGAYSKKKEISAERRFQLINQLYEDYLTSGIKLEEYKKVAMKTFD